MSFWKKNSDSLDNKDATKPTVSVAAGTQLATQTQIKSEAKFETKSEAVSQGSGGQGSGSKSIPTALSGSAKPEEILQERFGKTRSALGEGTVIQGKLSFDTPVRIDGKLSGEVFSSKALIIGSTGKINAKLEVATLVILGSVQGEILATERVELWSGASVEGLIRTPQLIIQDGAMFSGVSEMLHAHPEVAAKVKSEQKSVRSSQEKSTYDKASKAPAKQESSTTSQASVIGEATTQVQSSVPN